jgi:hypothetical protein
LRGKIKSSPGFEALMSLEKEEPTGTAVTKPRLFSVRRVNILLAAVVVGLLAFSRGEVYRRAEFFLTGAVSVDGERVYRDAHDTVSTGRVLETGKSGPGPGDSTGAGAAYSLAG